MTGERRPLAKLLLAHGARAAENALLGELTALLDVPPSAESLRAPVRVVVPSHSLRLHVSAELVRRRGRAVLGVQIQTLFGLALEVLDRCGEAPLPGRLLFDVLARRLARDEPDLAGSLEPLADGYAAVAGTVRDLLDAGLTPELADAAHEALDTDGPAVATRAEVRRARALVRVASHLEQGAHALGLGRSSTLLTAATERIVADPHQAVPSRAIWVHGFADATGVVLDLLEALLRHPRAGLVLDHPPDPAGHFLPAGERSGASEDGEARFTERLLERLSAVLGEAVREPSPDAVSGPLPPAAFTAGAAEAETREIARRVQGLLETGARPEGIGIVVRDLELYRLPLRRHLGALGIPFSGAGGTGSLEPPGRNARALLDLLARGGDLPADRWLDATAALGGRRLPPRLRVDLRLAFFALGAGRIRDIAELDVDRYLTHGSYALPVRQGLRPGASAGAGSERDPEDDPDSDDARELARETVAPKRRVDGKHLRAAVAAAGSLLTRLDEWPAEAECAAHFRRLDDLLRRDLGWRRRMPRRTDTAAGGETGERAGEARTVETDTKQVLATLAATADELPPRLMLRRDEVRVLLSRALERTGWSEIGGEGGGVQVLGAVEARSRTFDHLFLAGLSRGVFPRSIRPDPLLADDLRRVLTRVLPDVPVKQRGFSEERYLFAQLLSSSPRVTLSWPLEGVDGRPQPPSPLIERLAAVGGEGWQPERAPALWSSDGGWSSGSRSGGRSDGERRAAAVRPAREHAVLAALHAPRARFAAVLPAAVDEARQALGVPAFDLPAERIAAARLAVLAEVDPDLSTPEGRQTRRRLGPYLGFIGGLDSAPPDDPRRRDLFVTVLERIAACPWQVFLERLLRVEPTPDPVQSLPNVDPLLLGNAVHRVLERLVLDALAAERPPRTLAEAARQPAAAVAWPGTEELVRLLREVTSDLVVEDGVALRGMAKALAARALPVLAEAAKLDWSTGTLTALGAEVRGEVRVEDRSGSPRSLAFKADRADPGTGGLVLTDYKTGRPISDRKTERTRRQHFLRDVAAGKRLQAVCYALAEGAVRGRYAYLKPDLEHRDFAATREDRDLVDAFRQAVATAFSSWDAGAFFPRVVDPDGRREPIGCSYCGVAEACVRGDSGARLRLADWAERHRPGSGEVRDSPPEDPAETALLGVWELPRSGRRT